MFQSTRILVADDGQANRRLITVILEKVGCRVYTVENGKLALDRYMADGDFDLILMDMQMPVMDGYTATQSIRELDQTIPIVGLDGQRHAGRPGKNASRPVVLTFCPSRSRSTS